MKRTKWLMLFIIFLIILFLWAFSMEEESPPLEGKQHTEAEKKKDNIHVSNEEASLKQEKKEKADISVPEITEMQQDESNPVTSEQEKQTMDDNNETVKQQKSTAVAKQEVSKELPEAIPVFKPIGIPTIPAFLPESNSEPRTKPITHVVLHFSSNAANNPQDPYNVEAVKGTFAKYGVSANYLIGRDGAIYELVPENRIAYHAGKGSLAKFPDYKDILNQYSIGIEILAIGTKQEMSSMISGSVYDSINPSLIGYTNEQYQTLHILLKDILQRNTSITWDRDHIIGHEEYAPGRKTDPGSLFVWSKIGF